MAQQRRSGRPIEYDLLLTATLCLLAYGAVMVFSASSARALLSGQGMGTGLLVKYVIFAAIGIVAMLVVARIPLERLVQITGPLLLAAFVLTVAVRLPGIGVSVNGARRWIGAGPLTFQPSELMKLALVLYAARILAERPKLVESWQSLRPLLLTAGAGIGLVALQPDLGTALVCSFAMASMLIAAGIPLRRLGVLAGAGGALVLAYSSTAPYRMERLTAFLSPWKHSADAGYQVVQGMIAVGSGGMTGRGLGQSQQKNLFLPEAHTDFIFAIIGEELGTIGIVGLLVLYGMFAYAGLRIARNAQGRYAKLLAAGIVTLYLGQAMLNVFTVLGLAPLTGVPLPFISYGGTTLVTMLIGIGLVLNVAGAQAGQLRAVVPPRDQGDSRRDGAAAQDRDRNRRDGRPRRAVAGGRRRAAS